MTGVEGAAGKVGVVREADRAFSSRSALTEGIVVVEEAGGVAGSEGGRAGKEDTATFDRSFVSEERIAASQDRGLSS
jgi:hypothetical protein